MATPSAIQILCEDCQQPISRQAGVCPHCGVRTSHGQMMDEEWADTLKEKIRKEVDSSVSVKIFWLGVLFLLGAQVLRLLDANDRCNDPMFFFSPMMIVAAIFIILGVVGMLSAGSK